MTSLLCSSEVLHSVRESCLDADRNFQESLALLPSLRTLHILTLPTNGVYNDPIEARQVDSVFVDTCTGAFAEYVFQSVPRIKVLSIGRCSSRTETIGELAVRQRFYVRGKLVDLDGGETLAAVETPKSAVREMEPISDILDLQPEALRFVRYGHKD